MNTIWLYNSGQPFTDFDFGTNQSPNINPKDSNTSTDYSDIKEANAFNSGYSFARPLLSNPKAPAGTIGIYTTTTTGDSSAPAQNADATNADGSQKPAANTTDSANPKESSSKKKKGLRKIVPW